MTRAKVIWRASVATIFFGSLLFGIFADYITVNESGLRLGNRTTSLRPSESPIPSGFSVPLASPIAYPVTSIPTPTTTPIPPLDRQLEVALSVDYSGAQSDALRIVAEDAVLRMDYWTAIRAASATPYSSDQATNLAFVVACAIEDDLYDFASEAADKVRYTSNRDRLKVDVLKARRRATSEVTPVASEAIRSTVDRESMACFSPAFE